MLAIKPQSRPNILDILNKSFVRKKVASYVNDCIYSPPALAPTEVNDFFPDVLREQAEKLGIPGFSADPKASSRLQGTQGRKKPSGQPKQFRDKVPSEVRS
jgi:hypothetical protein